MNDIKTHTAKGRAAQSNRVSRYAAHEREAVDDGWDIEEDLPVLRTQVRHERPRSVITRNSSPDIPFDRSVTAYRGCEHGCIYCYARPSHAWLDMSPGLDFETKLIARVGAAEQLARELSKRGYRPAPLALGTMTDPYQPLEQKLGLVRDLLKVLWEFRHPVTVITKGNLIERDLDLLAQMAAENLIEVGISVTSLDRHLLRSLEPRAPAPQRRLATIERLSATGIPVRLQVAPVIPGLTDHELEDILRAGHAAGARSATMMLVRLPLEVADLFQEWLHEHVPGRAEKVLNRLRELHGGALYTSDFGRRFRGQGPWADLIQARFRRMLAELGMTRSSAELSCDKFAVPPRPGDQLSLF